MILKLVKAIFPSPTVLSFSTLLFSVSPFILFSSPFLPFLPTPVLPFPPAFPNSLLFVLPANVFSLSDSGGSSHPPRALGMQVHSLLSLCGSLSDCMKMNFYGLLADCPLLYITSLSAIMRLIAHSGNIGLCTNPFLSPFLVNANTP